MPRPNRPILNALTALSYLLAAVVLSMWLMFSAFGAPGTMTRLQPGRAISLERHTFEVHHLTAMNAAQFYASHPELANGNLPVFHAAVVFRIPYWAVALAALLLPGCRLVGRNLARRRVTRRRTAGRCVTCDYDLRASPGRCPECGAAAVAATRDAHVA